MKIKMMKLANLVYNVLRYAWRLSLCSVVFKYLRTYIYYLVTGNQENSIPYIAIQDVVILVVSILVVTSFFKWDELFNIEKWEALEKEEREVITLEQRVEDMKDYIRWKFSDDTYTN